MREVKIHVARGDVELGAFSLDEACELLDTGFIKPGDEAWTPGMKQWAPLGPTLSRLTAPGPNADWRDKVVAGSSALSSAIGRSVGKLVADVKRNAGEDSTAVAAAKKLALEQHLPKLKEMFAQTMHGKPAAVVKAATQDDEVMRKLFSSVYFCLPNALQRFVPHTMFVNFCLEHRQNLTAAVQSRFAPGAPDDSKPSSG